MSLQPIDINLPTRAKLRVQLSASHPTMVTTLIMATGTRTLTVVLPSIQYSYHHNSRARFPQPKCSEGTREEILEDLLKWACSDLSQGTPGICWLRGSAGAGKSAIAQTIAERCEGLASLFFSRTGPNRNTPKQERSSTASDRISSRPLSDDQDQDLHGYNPPYLHSISSLIGTR
ncbi:hypothetical protein L218DRAFT_991693 [Marasmius fiardii PR-910]|nr:hypothetical protein L218DRAFT_991693 [Marasmius fiardii PR-910]